MREERNAIERLVADAGWVDVPEDLRDRVIMAAAAAVRESRHAGWLDRVWFSTRWRVATAVTLFALALLNGGLPANTNVGAADGFGKSAYEAAEDVQHAARQLGLPDADCTRLGDAALVAASRSVGTDVFAGKE